MAVASPRPQQLPMPLHSYRCCHNMKGSKQQSPLCPSKLPGPSILQTSW